MVLRIALDRSLVVPLAGVLEVGVAVGFVVGLVGRLSQGTRPMGRPRHSTAERLLSTRSYRGLLLVQH